MSAFSVAAVDLSYTMEMTFWLPQTEAALAQVGADDHGERYPASPCYTSPNPVTCSWKSHMHPRSVSRACAVWLLPLVRDHES